jgi:hypothetical protein
MLPQNSHYGESMQLCNVSNAMAQIQRQRMRMEKLDSALRSFKNVLIVTVMRMQSSSRREKTAEDVHHVMLRMDS